MSKHGAHRNYGLTNRMLRPVTLTGRHVVLRPAVIDDAPALALATSESRENYLYNPVPNGPEDAHRYLERALNQQRSGERQPFTILFHGRVVGSTSFAKFEIWRWPPGHSLQRTDQPDVVEIGYTWLAHSAQRTGCNTEAKFLMLQYAFETWRVHRTSFRTDERNERSRNAIARLGATFEGIRRADMPSIDGRVRNSAYFSILAAEWPQVKERLSMLMTRT